MLDTSELADKDELGDVRAHVALEEILLTLEVGT